MLSTKPSSPVLLLTLLRLETQTLGTHKLPKEAYSRFTDLDIMDGWMDV